MEEMYCQSCGMPLVKAEDFATNKDGTPMSEYCIYCFKDGAFTGDISMEDMINISLKHMRELFKGVVEEVEEVSIIFSFGNALGNIL